VVALLRSLPTGFTEFMTHPGHHTAELENVSTRLKASRALELAALTSPEVRDTLTECGIELTRYSELPTAP
jgi:predicted glycoside hydrolase/deacetylase ChbG (UPF0249 family)